MKSWSVLAVEITMVVSGVAMLGLLAMLVQ